MVNSNTKGGRRERALIEELGDRGFVAMRAPSSGSATTRDLPDVLAGDGTAYYAIEVKASAGDPVYLDGDEVDALERFADGFGADPLIGTRFDYADWAFYIPRELHRTDGGNYRVKHPDEESVDAVHIDDLSV